MLLQISTFGKISYGDNLLAAASLLLAVYWLVCLLRPRRLTETILFSFVLSAALIAVWAYLLSPLNRLADLSAWALLGAATAALAGGLFLLFGAEKIPLSAQIAESFKSLQAVWRAETDGYQKSILILMSLAAFFVAAFNLILVLFTAPHAWDALTYHLPRMAYYLQQGAFSYFGANYWAQVVHPKNSTALLIYVFLTSGRSENLTQIIEYVSHGVFALSIYGVASQAGLSKTQSVFASLTGALLVSGVFLAVSSQNDVFIAACFGAATYSLFAHRRNPRRAYLFVAGLAISLALGAKSSAVLALPSLGLIALYALAYRLEKKQALHHILRLGAFTLAAGAALVLPSGYLDNYQRLGHPIAPQKVRQMHSFEGQSVSYILQGGGYNLLRFMFDFVALDGFPRAPEVQQAERILRLPLKTLTAPLDLESDFAEGFSPFRYENDRAVYWGVFGFGLIWIAAALAALGFAGKRELFILALAAFLFLAVQAFSGPYDSARGRYFLICALFAVPIAGEWVSVRSKVLRIYLALVALAGGFSAAHTASSERTLLFMNRERQLAYRQPKYYEQIKAFNFAVPPDAAVAVYLYPNAYEYPLFGQGLTRVILPINSFYQGLQPIPESAEYLLYAKGYPCPREEDRHLKGDWFLRKLDDSNRACAPP